MDRPAIEATDERGGFIDEHSLNFTLWFVVSGSILMFMALSSTILKRLPLTTAMFLLAVGFGLGPVGIGLLEVDPIEHATLLERVSKIAVLISLFTAGLKLRTPLSDGRWHLPVRLATISMLITIGLITLTGVFGLGLSLGAAVLLAAMLAPTDPVLASDVQVEHPEDSDRLRFTLTGEAGLNDGSAFPFVLLGLGLLGLHELNFESFGSLPLRWFVIDLLGATVGGLAIGGLLGTLVGRLVVYLRREHKEALGLDDFLSLGLIALAYGVAELAHTYGFLAVFAAGLALRRIERETSGDESSQVIGAIAATSEADEIATDPQKAPAYMAQAVLGFNEQLERIGEVVVVLLIGAMLMARYLSFEALWFVPLLLLVIRPVSILLGLLGSRTSGLQRGLMSWFGMRGIGSIYYLTYAIEQGLQPEVAQQLTGIVLSVVAVSVVVHGISVTPLMKMYSKEQEAGKT